MSIAIEGVKTVIVTEIVAAPGGGVVREVHFYDVEKNEAGGFDKPPVHTVRLKGDLAQDIELTYPNARL
jgi:hypothetical protein